MMCCAPGATDVYPVAPYTYSIVYYSIKHFVVGSSGSSMAYLSKICVNRNLALSFNLLSESSSGILETDWVPFL